MREGGVRRSEPTHAKEQSAFADAALVQVGVLLFEAQRLRRLQLGGGIEQLVGLNVVPHPADGAGTVGVEHDLGGNCFPLVVVNQQVGLVFLHIDEGKAAAAYELGEVAVALAAVAFKWAGAGLDRAAQQGGQDNLSEGRTCDHVKFLQARLRIVAGFLRCWLFFAF